jgi:hypothetical protein
MHLSAQVVRGLRHALEAPALAAVPAAAGVPAPELAPPAVAPLPAMLEAPALATDGAPALPSVWLPPLASPGPWLELLQAAAPASAAQKKALAPR